MARSKLWWLAIFEQKRQYLQLSSNNILAYVGICMHACDIHQYLICQLKAFLHYFAKPYSCQYFVLYGIYRGIKLFKSVCVITNLAQGHIYGSYHDSFVSLHGINYMKTGGLWFIAMSSSMLYLCIYDWFCNFAAFCGLCIWYYSWNVVVICQFVCFILY